MRNSCGCVIVFLGWFIPFYLNAQVLPDTVPPAIESAVEQHLEDAAQAGGVEADADWTVETDYLVNLTRHPLDLNRATADELTRLPGMTLYLVNQLISHRQQFGPLLSIYELQVVPGFTAELFARIRIFITVSGERGLTLTLPNGPTFNKLKEGRLEVTQRLGRILERQKGYTLPDTFSTGRTTSRYAGDPFRVYTQLRYSYANNLDMGITAEKDPGESFRFDPKRRYYGYDFLSFHLYLAGYKRLKQLVVGDYTLRLGQGLLVGRGLGLGRGAESVLFVKQNDLGIQPYNAVNENNFFRGAATNYTLDEADRWHILVFASSVWQDATPDTSTLSPDGFANQQLSGLHRTGTELAERKSLLESTLGGSLSYAAGGLKVSLSQIQTNYNRARGQATEPYRRFDFSGTANSATSLAAEYQFRNMNFFGELAHSNGAWAGIGGVLASLAPKVDFVLQLRNFDKAFYSPRGYTFAHTPYTPHNEQGVYIGLKLRPARAWAASVYADLYQRPWYAYRISAPSSGSEFFTQLEYTAGKHLLLVLRLRQEYFQQDLPASAGYVVKSPTDAQRTGARFEVRYTHGNRLALRSLAEGRWFAQALGSPARGWLLAQDATWRASRKLNLRGRLALYNVSGSNAAIYSFESSISSSFSIPAFQSYGLHSYLMLHYALRPHWQVWLRLAETIAFGASSVGTGLDQSPGNTRSQLDLQVRYVLDRARDVHYRMEE